MSFKKYCYQLSELKTFDDVLMALENTGVGSLIVVDKIFHLIGIVTDGDVRRALLNKKTDIESIINKSPETWSNSKPRQQGINYLKQIKRNILPIIDSNNTIVDVLCLSEINFNVMSNTVVIMAGGLGSRLYPLTKDTPKPMLLVNNKPILERIIEKLIDNGFKKFYISINYLGEQIKDYFQDGLKWNISIKYIEETKKLGTAGSISYLNNKIKEPFIVMNGDIITDLNFIDLINFHLKTKNLSTMCVYRKSYQIPFGVIEFNNKKEITHIKEKPKNEYYINMGIYVLNPKILKYIPNDTFYDMPTLFQKLIDDNISSNVYLFDGLWTDIGQIDDYKSITT
jgi:dTDP-glucose pyrophosphorylase